MTSLCKQSENYEPDAKTADGASPNDVPLPSYLCATGAFAIAFRRLIQNLCSHFALYKIHAKVEKIRPVETGMRHCSRENSLLPQPEQSGNRPISPQETMYRLQLNPSVRLCLHFAQAFTKQFSLAQSN